MKLSFDKFEQYETPQVTLCNPNSRVTESDGKITITDTVGVLSNPSGMNLKLNFNAPHELSFDYYRHKSADPIKQSFYDKIYEAIQTDRYIYLTDIGYFIISSVTDSDEDNIDKKSISLKSCEENEFATAEGLGLKEGTYQLHTQDNTGLLDLFLPKTAGWTIGFIDPALLTKYDSETGEEKAVERYVEKTEVDNGYNFLYTTVQDMFECIVEPDIIRRTISVYSRVYYAEHHLTDIHIAKYNLLKHKTVEENDEDKYTALNVQGKDESLEIRAVNPTGKNVIYNFEPRYSWMSKRLQEAVEKWQEKCESVIKDCAQYVPPSLEFQGGYADLQKEYYDELEKLFNEEQDIEVLELGLKQLESTRDFITSGAADSYLENIKLYCTQYNSNVNGNVDYAKRPFISPEEMVLAGYPEFSNPDEEVATTYDCDYAFMNGSGAVLYTIKMTPIIEDRTVLSVEGLDAYYDAMASSCSTKEQLLAYDAAHSKLIINIANGDTPRDNEGLTALDKTLMPIKNNHWATVKAFMKAAGLDMTNLSNLLNEIENRQTALLHVNSAITIKQSEINKATLDYNAHKSVVYINYEEPISQINKDCALDITAVDINGNTIFTADLLNELMTHIKPTEYVDEYMLVTDSMTYPQRFDKAKELMDRAQSQLVKISSGQKTYSIDTRSFLFNKQFKHFSEQLCAGAIIYVETKNDTMEQLHLTGIDINFDDKSTNFTLGNKYDRSDLKALYEDALGQNSKSFSELKYLASIVEDQQTYYKRDWAAELRTLTLDNVLTSEDQAFEINNRGLTGRKRQLNADGSWRFDENGNPFFEPEQVKLINNTLVFTNDNWRTAVTAVGKIAIGEDADGNVQYAYGINGQVLIGELILGNNLVLTGTGAGIKIKDGQGNNVFYADDNGNLNLSGIVTATGGKIANWDIKGNVLYSSNGSVTGKARTVLKSGSSNADNLVAFAAGVPMGNDYYTTTYANLQIYHDGTLRVGHDGSQGSKDANYYFVIRTATEGDDIADGLIKCNAPLKINKGCIGSVVPTITAYLSNQEDIALKTAGTNYKLWVGGYATDSSSTLNTYIVTSTNTLHCASQKLEPRKGSDNLQYDENAVFGATYHGYIACRRKGWMLVSASVRVKGFAVGDKIGLHIYRSAKKTDEITEFANSYVIMHNTGGDAGATITIPPILMYSTDNGCYIGLRIVNESTGSNTCIVPKASDIYNQGYITIQYVDINDVANV